MEYTVKRTLRPCPSSTPRQLCNTGKFLNLSVLPFLASKMRVIPPSEDVMKRAGDGGWEALCKLVLEKGVIGVTSIKGPPPSVGVGVGVFYECP